MHKGTPLAELLIQIAADGKQKRDVLVERSAIHALPEGTLLAGLPTAQPELLTPTAHAHGQMAQALDFPLAFYRHMMQAHPQEWADSLNALLQEEPGQRRMLRTLRGDLRAYLSDRYRRLDNEDVAAVMLDLISDRGFEVVSCEVTDLRLYIQATTPRVQGEVKPGDVVQAGFILANSEVGASSLSLRPMVYRLVCSNGAIMPDSSKVARHVGSKLMLDEATQEILKDDTRQAQDRAVVMAMRDVVDYYSSPDTFQGIVDRMRDAATAEVKGAPSDVVKVLAKQHGLLERESVSVLEEWLARNDRTRWGLANAVTSLAHTTTSYERGVELEAIGGEVIATTGKRWDALALAGVE